ncbi:SGNH hydrolase domain-containing protein [Nocardioides sp.]|uniref:SGNH hydrolase domain-containing protein n=1 Tax=Nocardioides sp. TaxID=35761 RepID=UPI002B27146D|nr:SGNH hydrolase domain-containing protein [Nocardioides sp.]
MRVPRTNAAPSSLRPATALLLVSALLTALLALAVAGPAPARALPAEELDVPSMPADCFGPAQTSGEPTVCRYNKFRKKRPTVVLWGDSHAWMYIPALRKAVRGQRVNFTSFVAGSCPPIATTTTPDESYSGKCERSNVNALAFVKKLHKRGSAVKVILGSNWSGFRIAHREIAMEGAGTDSGYDDYTRKMVALSHEGTPRLFRRLGKLGVDVDVIAQAAVIPERVAGCADGNDPYACDIPRWRALPEEGRTDSWLRSQMKKLKGAPRYLLARDAYCFERVCSGSVDGIFTWYDKLHLSATRTAALSSYFRPSVLSLRR